MSDIVDYTVRKSAPYDAGQKEYYPLWIGIKDKKAYRLWFETHEQREEFLAAMGKTI